MVHITTEIEPRQVYKIPKDCPLEKQMSKLEKHSKRFIIMSSTGQNDLCDITPRGKDLS